MAYETIRYEPGTIARVILSRTDKLNAQSWTMLAEMEDAFNEAVRDQDVRVIILSGEGRAFSAGHDLDTPDQIAVRSKGEENLDVQGAELDEGDGQSGDGPRFLTSRTP